MEGGGVEASEGVVIDPVMDPVHLGDGEVGTDSDNDLFDELNDDVCALCGDGGLLLCCEGPCLRSFHATREDDGYSGCATLGFTTAQVEAMQHFFCTNCTNRQHQCAGCGVLGSSDAVNAQVFRCSHATCGRFYHPVCIGAQLHSGDPVEAARCRDRVAFGVAFQCLRPHGRQPDFYQVE
ncbi:protein ENHANCED DOWNY MILDEW 2-like [Phragmites australis]|uniref:protein ENHANCED DOWNY MILDEW 2-like n=1 Tax=Phragmites australis TaxID=29695 RepID=UPI002D782386|nr:protein ENHANCED DOWNY MILDEW 2-like [Phragmites australis]